VKDFEKEYLELLDLKHRDILDSLRDGILNNDITETLEKVAAGLVLKYKPK
jgi:F-type H+-transporting ATPase subunit alpha